MPSPKSVQRLLWAIGISFLALPFSTVAQCGGNMEPGFAFLTSSHGCAPFTVNIQTIYLAAVPGTQYFINWGDGTAEQTYTQVGPAGVVMAHTYPLASTRCGYDVVIDAANACNPRGSVVKITTQVVVWTNDIVSISPTTYRICAGYAADVLFTDNSDWNCFPRLTRENNAPRWIEWMYGTGPLAGQIPGIQVNGVTPGSFPYLDPALGRNPIYPVLAPGQISLPINVPITALTDIGKQFEIKLKNWNQCNAYDDNLLDGNAFNPVNVDLVNGDNMPLIATARIVIVAAPQPGFVTRLGNAGGPVQTIFCLNDIIYFDNNTPALSGASFQNRWEFYDDVTGIGIPLGISNQANPTFSYPTAGQKLIRLSVRDQNAAGNCVAIYEAVITISPSLTAKILTTDLSDRPIQPDFCQRTSTPFLDFPVRLVDASAGVVSPTTQWRWEFFNESNVLVQQAPVGGGFSASKLGPFDRLYTNRGIYRVRLIVRDNSTSCESFDEIRIRIYEDPVPAFTATRVCQGQPTVFAEHSQLRPVNGESIVLREWDFNYDGITFRNDAAFNNQSSFTRPLGTAGTYIVALRTTTNQNGCSAVVTMPTTVDPLPETDFSPDISSGCSALTVTFTNNATAHQLVVIDRYIWEVEDGPGGFVARSTQRPADAGFTNQWKHSFVNATSVNKVVQVRLRAVTIHACETVSMPVAITVFPGAQSGFNSINYSPFADNCSPVTVDFTVDAQTQSQGPSNYQWKINDGLAVVLDTSTATTPLLRYRFANPTQNMKDFRVSLTSTMPTGCSGDSVRTIRISPVPVADFGVDTLVFDCDRMRFRFRALQQGLQYHWTIAENTITMVNTVGYNGVLEYEVSKASSDINLRINLETTNIANCSSAVQTKILVVPRRQVISVGFDVTPREQTLPAATIFITNTTSPGPWSYRWNFGDGLLAMSSDADFQHTYASAGVYTVTLEVGHDGCVETRTLSVTIRDIPPKVDFMYDPAMGCSPLTVHFTNLSQFTDPGTYVWNFGDGRTTSKAIHPTHVFSEPGKYTVSLSASNSTGQAATEVKTQIIEVFTRPSARFETKPKLIYIPGGILFTRNNSFDAGRFYWDFGDGTSSEEFEPQHSYPSEGEYTVSLIAISPHNCRDTLSLKNSVIARNGGQILIPNAFSPNQASNAVANSIGSVGSMSDGKNDTFLPLMRGVTQFEMLVFNRWGELLFQSQDAQFGWDGYYQGKLCEQDVYMYKIVALFGDGERVVRTGDINLIR